MQNLCAAILAGGLGTRLRSALADTPKVLARVGNRPFVTILLDRLESAGIERVVMLTGFQADQVRQTLGDRHGAMALDYSVEAIPMGTGGALRDALPSFQTDRIILLNGDSFCDVDFAALISIHARHQADVTLTLTHVPDAERFGLVEATPQGAITRFMEKPAGNVPGWINAGVYVLERALIESIPQRRAVSLERELLPEWVQHRRLFCLQSAGSFLDIGTPESYAAATFLAESSRVTKSQRSNQSGTASFDTARKPHAIT